MGIEYDVAYAEAVAQRRARIAELVAAACAEAGRSTDEVTVCAVSKTVDVAQVAAARAAGYVNFAENRPQELERKLAGIGDDPAFEGVSWHMIGNLQENKINHVLACQPALIHSVSSAKLAEAVSKRAAVRGMRQPVLLEVNVSGEQSKGGMAPEDMLEAFGRLTELPGIEVRGLMTMAPQGDSLVAERTFCGLRELRDSLCAAWGEQARGLTELSMGMSGDLEYAVEAGSTMIRVGTFLLGEREQ